MAKNKAADNNKKAKSIADSINLNAMTQIAYDVTDALNDVAQDSALQALLFIQAPESDALFNRVFDRAVSYAADRGAEMVGMKWVDGELVENPKAEWVITQATRDEIQSLIVDGLNNSLTRDEIANNIESAAAFSPERADLISATEIGTANSQGALEGYKAARDVVGLKLKKYWIPDEDPCDDCQENGDAGLIDLDDDFPSGDDAPLAHPNCFIEGTNISALGVTRAYRRWFEGEIITVNIGSNNFSVTRNHPILTNRGFIFAKDLKIGDSLAQCISINKSSLVNPNNNYIETRIEQIFDSLLMACGGVSATMPTTTEHFHGDGVIDGEVNIVNANSNLEINNSAVLNKVENDFFRASELGNGESRLISKSALQEFVVRNFSAFDSVVGGCSSDLSTFSTAESSLSELGLTFSANSKSESFEASTQNSAMTSGSLSDNDTAFARQIRFVKIIDLIVSEFRGHVYNLETVDGWYIAESIITSNCECTIAAEEVKEENQDNSEEE